MNRTGNYNDFVNNNQNINQNNQTTDSGGIGRLKVFTFSANGALPISGSIVRIYSKNSANQPIIHYELVSNYDGETEEVTLETPSIGNSATPFEQAYAVYYVDIEHPDFQSIKEAVVQIFPNTITVLPANLQPQSWGV